MTGGTAWRLAYGILSAAIVALGLVHMAAAFSRYNTLSASAYWFFNGGIVLVFAGVINLLNRPYGAIAPGLRWFCRAANIGMVGLSAAGGLITHASTAQLVVVVGVFSAVAVLSWLP